jgi:hypothetical protein
LPQETSFRGCIFRATAFAEGAEARYRSIRNLFHTNRDREQEGDFYSLEKRAFPKSLGRNWRAWLPRLFSKAYDWTSAYGRSYERALVFLLALQVVFGLLYSLMSKRFAFYGRIDSQIAAFTLAQIVKPFEILSARDFGRWPYAGVYPGEGGWWVLVTVLHGVASLTLVALFLLALRWRFRRD